MPVVKTSANFIISKRLKKGETLDEVYGALARALGIKRILSKTCVLFKKVMGVLIHPSNKVWAH